MMFIFKFHFRDNFRFKCNYYYETQLSVLGLGLEQEIEDIASPEEAVRVDETVVGAVAEELHELHELRTHRVHDDLAAGKMEELPEQALRSIEGRK